MRNTLYVIAQSQTLHGTYTLELMNPFGTFFVAFEIPSLESFTSKTTMGISFIHSSQFRKG
jgi:hypothetical protein